MITPRQKYNNAVLSARQRGIDWQFTYDTWLSWWGDDIALRGPKSNDLCMARFGDTGPYHPDNVRKTTVAENIREMRSLNKHPSLGKKHSIETKIKISNRMTGKKHSPEVNASKGRKKILETRI